MQLVMGTQADINLVGFTLSLLGPVSRGIHRNPKNCQMNLTRKLGQSCFYDVLVLNFN